MQDFFGRELAVGDRVALCPKGCKTLVEGRVAAFTRMRVRVEYTWPDGTVDSVDRVPEDLVKDTAVVP